MKVSAPLEDHVPDELAVLRVLYKHLLQRSTHTQPLSIRNMVYSTGNIIGPYTTDNPRLYRIMYQTWAYTMFLDFGLL